MTIDEMIAMYEKQATEYNKMATAAQRRVDELRRARLDAKVATGTATRSDVESVEGTDACGYRW